jgi:hypothetical protein
MILNCLIDPESSIDPEENSNIATFLQYLVAILNFCGLFQKIESIIVSFALTYFELGIIRLEEPSYLPLLQLYFTFTIPSCL